MLPLKNEITHTFFFASEDTINQDTSSNENDIVQTDNVASNFQDNAISSNIIDDIMRKHQQFGYTLGNSSSDILPQVIQKYITKHFTKVMFFGIHNLVLMKYMAELLRNGKILVVKMEH